jgi:hypothetical protein
VLAAVFTTFDRFLVGLGGVLSPVLVVAAPNRVVLSKGLKPAARVDSRRLGNEFFFGAPQPKRALSVG